MHAVVVYLSVRLSVSECVSVTLRYCVKTANRRITQIMTHDRPGTLVLKWDVLYHSCRISTDKHVAHPSAIAEPLVYTGGIYQCLRKDKNHPHKGRGYGHVIYLNSCSPMISPERLKLETSTFVHWFNSCRFSVGGITNCPLNGDCHGHVTSLNFRK